MRIALTYNEKRTLDEREAEFDSRATIDALAARLARLGHTVATVDVGGSITHLIDRLMRIAPDCVFDIAEGERGAFREAFYPALFEQLGLPCTGSPPSTRALCLDKWLAERIVAAAGVHVPGGVVVKRLDELRALEPPLIVKPNFEGSSKGITSASVVETRSQLAPAVQACLDHYPEGALVERFVRGRDVSVAWADGLGWLPTIAYHYNAAVYDYTLKHVTPERVRVEIPAALDDDVALRLRDAASRAFTALGVTGYGRADFRISESGEVVFIELNPLPSLADGELFAAAAAMGAPPEALLACIVRSARMPIREPCAMTG
ncbi:MAG: ATP-grasp domain-containing protein [Myxococcota bacterium]|nr:ATP-grasp domain-containing protein [Myxococcota bacterium]